MFRLRDLIKGLRFSNIKLTWKFIGMAIIVSVVPIIVVSGYSTSNSSNIITDSIYASNGLYTEVAKDRIDTYFESREIDALMLANSEDISRGLELLNTFTASKEEVTAINEGFKSMLEIPVDNYGFTDIFITNKYGEVAYSLKYDKLDLAPLVFSNDFVNIAMEGQQSWSKLFRNSYINDNILVLSTPITSYETDDSTPIGTLNMVLNQNALSTLVQEGASQLGQNVDSFLIDETGLLWTNTLHESNSVDAALNVTIETKAVAMTQEAIEEYQYVNAVTERYISFDGHDVIGTMIVTKIGDTPVGMITEVGVDEAMAKADELSNIVFWVTIVIILIAAAIAMIISFSITKPISRIMRMTNRISNYNLNLQVENQSDRTRKDEIGDLYRAIEQIDHNLLDLVREVDSSAEDVVKSSKSLHEGAVESMNIASTIAQEMTEISKGSGNQAVNTDRALNDTNELNSVLNDNRSQLGAVVNFTSQVSELAGSGLDIVNELVRINEETQKTNDELHDSIEKSIDNFKDIEIATSVIIDIAEQTNLLSLNASIEAARAGEHGRGFSVVSDEIRKLAEQAKASSHQIRTVIDRLHKDNKEVETRVNELNDISRLQINSVNETKVKYNEINGAISETMGLVAKLNDYQENIDRMRIDLEENIVALSIISEENSASSNNVSDKVSNQTEISDSIVHATEELDVLSTKLKDKVSKFKY